MNRVNPKLHLATLLAASVCCPVVAFAQDANEGASTAQPAAAAPATDTVSQQEDFDAFWAKQRQVRVLQRRLFEKDGDFQLTLSVGSVPNDPFIKYIPVSLRAGYYVTESVEVELAGSYMAGGLQYNTDLGDFLKEKGDYGVFVQDKEQWRANVVALWSPIYGKFAFAGKKLAHFDWFFGAGFGALQTAKPKSANDLATEVTELKPEAIVATGWNIHLTQMWALRLDVRQFIFQKESGGTALPTEISLGGSVFF